MPAAAPSYLIVGGGLFGSSAALDLRKTFPSSKVTVIDQKLPPHPTAATSDFNKIIRADYGDRFYMKLAVEACVRWRSDPVFKPYYHEPGMLFVSDSSKGKNKINAFKELGVDTNAEVLSMQEARTRWKGVFRDAHWDGVAECYFNPSSGWGDGDGALRSLVQSATDHGATYKTAKCQSLIIEADGSCTGITLEDGTQLHADNVLLATGAWTAHLLAESAPNNQKLHAGDRLVAAAAVQCNTTCPAAELDKLSEAPVTFNGMSHTEGESIPPNAQGYMKFNYEASLTNKQMHAKSQQEISVPPSEESRRAWSQDVPNKLKTEIKRVVQHTYGHHIDGIEIESYRMCWDAVTPSQDFIISPHPHCRNLFVATGGSFHSWKFMPIIGNYIVKMLTGELDESYAGRWAWDKRGPISAGAITQYLPRRDLKDLWDA